MYINSQNQLYFGDCAVGDREATPEEIAEWELSRLPKPLSPLEQIRALEAAKADDTAKIIRQTLLRAVFEEAMKLPQVALLLAENPYEAVKAQVISDLVRDDPGFRLMYELEQQVIPLRAQIP
jgi:hypothetical protein